MADTWIRRMMFVAAALAFMLAVKAYARDAYFVANAALGYEWANMPAGNISVSFLCALAPAFWLPTRIRSASDLAMFYIYAVIYIPPQALGYYFLGGDSALAVRANITYLAAFTLTDWVRTRGGVRCAGSAEHGPHGQLVFNALLGLGIFLALVLIATRTLDVRGFDLSQVYEQRMIAREESRANILSAYAFPFLLYGVSPLLLIAGLHCRRMLYVAFSLAAFCLTFAVAGTKSSLLVVPLIVLAVILVKWPECHAGAWILAGLTAAILLSLFALLLYGYVWLDAIVARRFLIAPAAIAFDYYTYFTDNPFFYCGKVNGLSSLLAWFGFDSPYQATKGFTLGEWRFGNQLTNMNTNAWVDAYADGGVFGVVLMCVIVGLFFRFLDRMCNGRRDAVIMTMLMFYGFLLTESSLPGMILGSGLIISIPALWAYARSRRDLAPTGKSLIGETRQ